MNQQKLKGGLVVSAYSRPNVFQTLVESIFSAAGSAELEKVFLIQDSNAELVAILNRFKDSKTLILPIPAPSSVPLVNINFNRWHSQVIAFDIFRCDWVIAFEEDVEIDKRTFSFVSDVFLEFWNRKYFRGINLGSYEAGAGVNEYSILNQGLHAQASAIPSASWERIKSRVKVSDLNRFAYDWLVEPTMRSGYMVVPNASYFKDNGWSQPTHAPKNPFDIHYVKLEKSFANKSSLEIKKPTHNQVHHSWPNSKVFQNTVVRRHLETLANVWKFSHFRLWLHGNLDNRGLFRSKRLLKRYVDK